MHRDFRGLPAQIIDSISLISGGAAGPLLITGWWMLPFTILFDATYHTSPTSTISYQHPYWICCCGLHLRRWSMTQAGSQSPRGRDTATAIPRFCFGWREFWQFRPGLRRRDQEGLMSRIIRLRRNSI